MPVVITVSARTGLTAAANPAASEVTITSRRVSAVLPISESSSGPVHWSCMAISRCPN